jgi:hypothetical protein
MGLLLPIGRILLRFGLASDACAKTIASFACSQKAIITHSWAC